MDTLLIQLETILNSLPLCLMSSDPADLNVLSLGHFLSINKFARWQLVQSDFWKRHIEYLNPLQQRTKWYTGAPDIALYSVVLIKEGNISPLPWRVGRVVEKHPGIDGICRVITLRTTRVSLRDP